MQKGNFCSIYMYIPKLTPEYLKIEKKEIATKLCNLLAGFCKLQLVNHVYSDSSISNWPLTECNIFIKPDLIQQPSSWLL